jgi:ferritin-like metal-binding protein YciE
MPDTQLKKLLIACLQDMLGADRRLLKAFPRLARAAADKSVRKLCREGIDYTKERTDRLERALRLLDARPRARPSPAMTGLIDEALDAVHDSTDEQRDAAILSSVQKISQYGCSGYWTLCAYAEALGETKTTAILMKSLKEKEEAIGEEMHMAESDIIPRLAREDKIGGNKIREDRPRGTGRAGRAGPYARKSAKTRIGRSRTKAA